MFDSYAPATLGDCLTILQIVAGRVVEQNLDPEVHDIDRDGKFSLVDGIAILKDMAQ